MAIIILRFILREEKNTFFVRFRTKVEKDKKPNKCELKMENSNIIYNAQFFPITTDSRRILPTAANTEHRTPNTVQNYILFLLRSFHDAFFSFLVLNSIHLFSYRNESDEWDKRYALESHTQRIKDWNSVDDRMASLFVNRLLLFSLSLCSTRLRRRQTFPRKIPGWAVNRLSE